MNIKVTLHRTVMIGAVALLFHAVTGCTQSTSLGISSEQIVARDGAKVEATHYSTLTLSSGEVVLPNAYVGDIDGDGLDDILIGGMQRSAPAGGVPDMTVYLFYGHPAFPEALAAADADATFDSGAMPSLTLGDASARMIQRMKTSTHLAAEISMAMATPTSSQGKTIASGCSTAEPQGITAC